jgi:MFS family permease
MKTLLPMMLKEEFRMHASYSSKYMFLAFPIMTAFFSFAIAVTSERIFESTPLSQVLLMIHVGAFIYGISVGAFGFLGRMYVERQWGERSFLVAVPQTLPISFKKTFFGLYARDVVFYLMLLLFPATVGLLASIPITHFNIVSVLFLFLSAFLSFLVGISLSFFVSVVYIRNTLAFIAVVASIFVLFIGHGIFGWYPLEYMLPGLGLQFSLPPFQVNLGDVAVYLLIALALVALFDVLSVLLVKDKFEPKKSGLVKYALPGMEEKVSFAKKYKTLLSKELVDLGRSGTVTKMFFSFVTPLLFLSFTAWFFNTGLALPVGFNTVFYGAMVGFFGVLLYSWLNNVDITDYYATLPVTVPQVIKAKLLAFVMMTVWISTIFVVAISWLNNDTSLLWLAIPVMFIVSIYMVVMIAYLTGLRTNSFLFDPGVLIKFSIMAILPDLCLTILSFTLKVPGQVTYSILGIVLVCVILIGTTWILYRGIDKKWARTEFGE